MPSIIKVYGRNLNLSVPDRWSSELGSTRFSILTDLLFKREEQEVVVSFHLHRDQLWVSHHTPNLTIIVDGKPLRNTFSANVRNGADITLAETESGLQVSVENKNQ